MGGSPVVSTIVCAALGALIPFAALLWATLRRREPLLERWKHEAELRAAGPGEVVRVRVALAPDVRHTIWSCEDGLIQWNALPPLEDERGRPVELSGPASFAREALEIVTTRMSDDFGGMEYAHPLDQIAWIRGGAELYVQAHPTDRGATLLLAAVDDELRFRSRPFPPWQPPPPRPRPVVWLHVPALAAIALATTGLPALAAWILPAPVATVMPVVALIAALGVTVRAPDVVVTLEVMLRSKRARA